MATIGTMSNLMMTPQQPKGQAPMLPGLGGGGAYQAPTSTQFSNGIKAKSPGAINTTQNTTLKPVYQAPASQQKAGGTQNGGSTQSNTTPPPLTGNVKTPSGATVNASTGQVVTPPPTFGGTMGALVGASTQGSPAAQQYTQQTAQYGAGNIPIAQNAANIMADYGKQIADVANNSTVAQQTLMTAGGPSAPLVGGALAQAQLAASREQALGTAEQAALQGTGQQLTAQQQAEQAANAAAGQAYTGQGQTITGLTGAGGLIPEALRYGGSALDPSVIAQTYAQQVRNGQMSPQDAQSAMNSLYGGAGSTFLNNALVPSGYNYNVGAGQAAAQQQNTTAVGTAPVNAPLNVYNQQLGQLGQSQTAAIQIAQFGNQLLNTMSQTPANGGLGINPYSSQFANEKLNQLKTQFNDPKYATFNTNIAGLQARVANLLQTGEIPTAATAGAQAIVSGNATLASMKATLDQIGAEAGAITGSQAQVASTAYQQAQQAASVPQQNAGGSTVQTSAGSINTNW